MNKLISIAILVIGFSLQSLGQRNSYGFHLNIMTVQGETSQGALITDDIALGLGVLAEFPLVNPRYEFSWKLDYLSMRMDYISNLDPNSLGYAQINASQYSASGGVNIYLGSNHNMANIYQPFRPYLSVSGGLIYQNNQVEQGGSVSFDQVSGGFVSPLAELGVGIKIRINPFWAFNMHGSLRSSFGDAIDGLVGNTNSPDLMGQIRMGLNVHLR